MEFFTFRANKKTDQTKQSNGKEHASETTIEVKVVVTVTIF